MYKTIFKRAKVLLTVVTIILGIMFSCVLALAIIDNVTKTPYVRIIGKVRNMMVFDALDTYDLLKDNLFAKYNDSDGNILFYKIIDADRPTEIGILVIDTHQEKCRLYYGVDLVSSEFYVYDINFTEKFIDKDKKAFKYHMTHDELIQYIVSIKDSNCALAND